MRYLAALTISALLLAKLGADEPGIAFNEHLLEGWASELDLEDVDAVFEHVYSRLPDEVKIYPSENYYYWKLAVGGRNVWGNIRLPAGRRDRGVVSFGYAEFDEFPSLTPSSRRDRLARSKYFTKADGLLLTKKDRFTYEIDFADKKVLFHLHQLDQSPPEKFALRENEVFVQRTFDESGVQFILIFNTERNHFNWILNEEDGVVVPDTLRELADGILLGKRTGFVFWEDRDRKVLASIRKLSVRRNDYYDGPFDQLADNYADEVEIRKYMELALPGVKGRIDKYGYYTNRERPIRVALSNYGSYYTYSEAVSFVKNAIASGDPHYFIAKSGRVEPKTKSEPEGGDKDPEDAPGSEAPASDGA